MFGSLHGTPASVARTAKSAFPPARPRSVVLNVVSDLHVGSSYCLERELTAQCRRGFEAGATATAVPGDLIDGESEDHGRYEAKGAQGQDAQLDRLLRLLPYERGHVYYIIGGNHDGYALDRVGSSACRTLAERARAEGRADFVYLGERAGRFVHGGALVEMWHPRGGGAGLSALELRANKWGRREEPDVLLVGHFHKFAHVVRRGAHAILCPSFQRGGGVPEVGKSSAFANSCAGPSETGGLLLTMRPGERPGAGLQSCGVEWFRA